MGVDYNNIATEFARSRIWMKWQEIEYISAYITQHNISLKNILDVWCGSGRLLESLIHLDIQETSYLWIDMSEALLEQAKKSFPSYSFQCMNMLQISELQKKFSAVFLIASFHHLESESDRVHTLASIYKSLEVGGYIFLTNWYLTWGENAKKYAGTKIPGKENDFSIKFADTWRYYHGFTREELESIAIQTWFQIIENRVFSWERNILTILKK